MATEFENIIKSNAQKYYTDASQAMSDEVFDAVVDEIRKENPNSEVLKTGWGYEVNDNNKVKHLYGHVGSLKKVRTFNEVKKALDLSKQDVLLSAKLDGMSVVLYYTNGVLDLALTRGDGEYGIDITEKVIYLIGNKINDTSFTGAVRGEILMTVPNFEAYSKLHPEAKNHRNSAIGLINGDSITEDYKYLTLAVYSVVGQENSDLITRRDTSANDNDYWLDYNFAYTAPTLYLDSVVNSTELESTLESCRKNWSEYWNIDGIVINLNSLSYDIETHEIVYTAVAWKFGEDIKITKIKHIEWTMSKNNCYIPVAVFEPIELAGTTVKRATAFNAKFVKDNNIQKGTIIAVAKRGEIIPQIIEIVDNKEV